MGWKAKEKPLTAEEAIAHARQELAPFWFGSTPLLAGIKSGETSTAHPLDAEFAKGSWMVFFVDPTRLAGENLLEFARAWEIRYAALGLRSLAFISQPYVALRDQESVIRLLKKNRLEFISAVDFDGALSAAFGARNLPKFILIDRGKTYFERDGESWIFGCEEDIQRFLRSRDPGMPLLSVVPPVLAYGKDTGHLELGKTGVGRVKVDLKGRWVEEGEFVKTDDPTAELSFSAEGSRVSLVAQAVTRLQEAARIAVEVNGAPAYEAIAGASMGMDGEGPSQVRIGGGRLYHLLAGLPAGQRNVTLSFPAADRVTVAIYGIRFGE